MTDRAGFPSGPYFYDRAGKPLGTREWAQMQEDERYRRVAISAVRGYLISTVWLGIDMNFLGGPPELFETMSFDEATGEPAGILERYTTEDEALAGHRAIALRIEHGDGLE